MDIQIFGLFAIYMYFSLYYNPILNYQKCIYTNPPTKYCRSRQCMSNYQDIVSKLVYKLIEWFNSTIIAIIITRYFLT